MGDLKLPNDQCYVDLIIHFGAAIVEFAEHCVRVPSAVLLLLFILFQFSNGSQIDRCGTHPKYKRL